jgi:hypothetical protein
LFVAGLLPFTVQFVVHHPDERHYTDAAIAMVRSGDYFIPQRADGSPRFEKPILTYWCVAASYTVLGINPLASRLPFLLAGCAVIWLTYRLALLLFGRREVADLAALILLGHPLLLLSATRSMPDVLFCLFTLLSAHGFLGLIVGVPRAARHHLAAYAGAGLAVATKGLPVLLLVAWAWAFCRFHPRLRFPPGRLCHWPSMLLGAALAAGWFVSVLLLNREDALRVFWFDQVTDRVMVDTVRVPAQFLFALICFGLGLVPWSLLAVPALLHERQLLVQGPSVQQCARQFILFWALLVAVVMGFTSKFSVRYVLLVSPLLAVLIADLLARAESRLVARWTRMTLVGLLVLLGVLHCGVTATAIQIGMTALDLALVGLLTLTFLGLAVCGLAGRRLHPAECLGLGIFLLVPLGFLAVRPFVLPDQGEQIARSLKELGYADGEAIGFVGRPPLASKVRVCTGGRVDLHEVPQGTSLDQRAFPNTVIGDRYIKPIDGDRFLVRQVSTGFRDVLAPELVRAVCTGRLHDYLADRRQGYWLIMHGKLTTDH